MVEFHYLALQQENTFVGLFLWDNFGFLSVILPGITWTEIKANKAYTTRKASLRSHRR